MQKNGKLAAVGKLDVVTRGPGKDLHRVKNGVTMYLKKASVAQTGTFGSGAKVPASARTAALGSCDVLNLVLGPLDLNLLGLEVHLNQVVLDVVAAVRCRRPAGQPALRRRRPARRPSVGVCSDQVCRACSTRSWPCSRPDSGPDTYDGGCRTESGPAPVVVVPARARTRVAAMTSAPYTLVLLRHGESEWNAKNLFTGWVDVRSPTRAATRPPAAAS